jgi:hypothetical protein
LSIVLLLCGLLQGNAHAACLEPQEQGSWTNVTPETHGVISIELRFVCQDHVLDGAPYPPGPAWFVHAVGKCAPVDCDWHEVSAQRLATAQIIAVYDQGFARRYVYLRMSKSQPGLLWAWIYTDFRDPTRGNYGVHDWFRRVNR